MDDISTLDAVSIFDTTLTVVEIDEAADALAVGFVESEPSRATASP